MKRVFFITAVLAVFFFTVLDGCAVLTALKGSSVSVPVSPGDTVIVKYNSTRMSKADTMVFKPVTKQ